MESQNKDFVLALYNKLWENINNKDTRLWTFLSIYGAAVALAFGAGKLIDMQVYASFLVLILTFWALFIVLNADWWDLRNRLMVAGIEHKFPEATRGVIPASYRGVRVVFMGHLNQVSVVLLVGVGLAFYLHTLWPFFQDGSITGLDILLMLSVLYLSVAWGCWVWVAQVERRLREYYTTAKGLQEEVPSSDFALAKAATEAAKQAAARQASRAVAARSVVQAISLAVPHAVQQGAGQPTPQQAAESSANHLFAVAQAMALHAPQPPIMQAVLQATRNAVPAGAGVNHQAGQEVLAMVNEATGIPILARQVVVQAVQAALAHALQQGDIHQVANDAAQAVANHVAQAAEHAAHDEDERAAAAEAVARAAERELLLHTDTDFAAKELAARKVTHWRMWAFCVLLVVSAVFDIACLRNTAASPLSTGMAALGVIAQVIAACLYVGWARQYYRAQPNNLASYALRLFTRTPDGRRSWPPYWIPFAFCLLIPLSGLLQGLAVYLSKPSLPLRADQVSRADIRAEREALLEKWERLQKRSWDLEEAERKRELSDYLKKDEAQQHYATKTDLESVGRDRVQSGYLRADEAQQRFATKAELESIQKRLQSLKKGP
jgi:hypothetical protein